MKKLLLALFVLFLNFFNTTAQTCNVWSAMGVAGFSEGRADYSNIAIDRNGTPYVVYSDFAYSQKATVMKFDGVSWVTVGTAGFSAGQALYTTIAIDRNGIPYVAYRDAASSVKVTVKKFDGTSWTTVGTEGFSAGQSVFIDLALDAAGTPYVSYTDYGNSAKITVMKFNGAVWVNVGAPGFSVASVEYTSIAIDTAGTPYVAYKDAGTGVKATVKKFDGSSWVTVGTEGFSAGYDYYNDLEIDSNNTLYLCYRDDGNGRKATVMKFDGATWNPLGSVGFTVDSVEFITMAISRNGSPFVAYRDAATGRKISVMKYNGSSWEAVGNSGFSADQVSYTSIAIDSAGIIYVVYRDKNSSSYATAMKFIACTSVEPISGVAHICRGTIVTFSDVTSGGSWSSNDTTVAIINSVTGGISAISTGNCIIKYSLSDSLYVTFSLTIDDALSYIPFIHGAGVLCAGSVLTLTDDTTGGIWTSTNPDIASVNSSGTVSGSSAGETTIYYTIANSCGTASDSQVIMVNTTDAGTITGATTVYAGYSISLSSTVPGGMWTASNSNAAVNASTGLVTGATAGLDTILYTATNSCGSATDSFVITVLPSPLPCYLPADSLVAWYPFTGNSNDSSGHGHDGATFGATLTTDRFGNANSAYYFDGSGSYISAPYSSAFNMASSTWNIWYKLTQPNSNNGTGRFIWGSDFSTGNHISHVILSDTPLVQIVGSSFREANSHQFIGDDNWHMLTMTYDQAMGQMSIYNDGALRNTVSLTSFSWSGNDLRFGVSMDPYWQNFYGSLDDAALYSRVLSGSEIAQLYNYTPSAPVISGASQVCAGNSMTLTGSIAGGSWQTADAAVATVSEDGIITGIAAGNTLISYTLNGVCGSSSDTAIVAVLASPNAGTITGADTVCRGSVSMFTTTGGSGTWQTSNPLIATVDAVTGNLYAVGSGAITLSYTASTPTCGNATSVRQVFVNVAPQASLAASDTMMCLGHPLLLNAVPFGGMWVSATPLVATVNTSGVVTAATAGTATFAYIASNACGADTAWHNVSVHGYADATATSPSTVCITAGTTTLTGVTTSPGDVWLAANSNLVITGSSAVLANAGLDTITHIAYNACGDADTAMYVITILGVPDAGVITGADTLGTGVTATLTASVPGGIWQTTGPAIGTVDASGVVTTITFSDTFVISYTVTNGCLSNSVVHNIVVVPCSGPADAGNITGGSSLCMSATENLTSDGLSGGTWSSSNTSVATVSAGGVVTGTGVGVATITYAVVTISCGSDQSVYTITVNDLPALSPVSGPTVVAALSSVTVTDTASGGIWSSSDITKATINAATGVVTGVAPGNTIITYSKTNSAGCTSVVTYGLTVAGSLTSTAILPGGTVTICNGNAVTLVANTAGGATDLSYQWYRNGIVIAAATNDNYVTNLAGAFSVVVSNAAGSDSISGASVVYPLVPVVHLTGTNTLYTGSFATYQWYENLVPIPGATASILNAVSSGVYLVRVTDGSGCVSTSAGYYLGPVGIQDLGQQAVDISVYPNPATNVLYIDASVAINVRVVSTDGKTVIEARETKIIDVSNLADGMYVLMIYNEDGLLLKAEKIVKED